MRRLPVLLPCVLALAGFHDPQQPRPVIRSEANLVREPDWRQGGEAQVLVDGPAGSAGGATRVTIAPGTRSFVAAVPLRGGAVAGTYSIGVRVSAAGGPASLVESSEAARSEGALGEPIAFRSATRPDAVASFLWRRTEAARIEAALADSAAVPSVRLLDRAGAPLPVPVDLVVREDPPGRRAVATVALAQLSPGDYFTELTSGSTRRIVPLRVER